MSCPVACRQRIGLACALFNNPDILLIDEALLALDQLIRAEMQNEIINLQTQHKRTIVFISHDLDEVMLISDRIVTMQDGEVIQVGTPDEILNNPANDYVSTFFLGVDISHVFSAKDKNIAQRRPVTLMRNPTILAHALRCNCCVMKTVIIVMLLNAGINLSVWCQ